MAEKKLQTVCNKCGKEFDVFDSQEDFSIVKPTLGYGTRYDGDGLELHLCCECMNDIIEMCKASPVIEK